MVHAVNYPGANRTAQWGGTGRPVMANVTKLLLHTTESSGWPSYGSFYPTLTFNPWLPRGKRWRQHYPINRSASTLENAGTYKTNRASVCQVEVVAYCDPAKKTSSAHVSKISADALAELGEFLAWLHREWAVDLYLAKSWPAYPKSYGADNGVRMTTAEFTSFSGVCGHMHAPGNDHGDPGDLDVKAILAAAKAVITPTPKPAPVPAKPVPAPVPTPAPVDSYAAKLSAWGFAKASEFQCWLWNQPLADCDGALGPKEKAFLDAEDDTKYGTAILKGYPVNYPYGAGNVSGANAYVLGYHAGDDHATGGKTGVAVHTPRSGKVVEVGYDSTGWGHYVVIAYTGTDDGRRARFCHLASVSVTQGAAVAFNDVIGKAGQTGNATGIHCHYQEEITPFWTGASTVAAKKKAVVQPFYNRSPLADYGDGPAQPSTPVTPAPDPTPEPNVPKLLVTLNVGAGNTQGAIQDQSGDWFSPVATTEGDCTILRFGPKGGDPLDHMTLKVAAGYEVHPVGWGVDNKTIWLTWNEKTNDVVRFPYKAGTTITKAKTTACHVFDTGNTRIAFSPGRDFCALERLHTDIEVYRRFAKQAILDGVEKPVGVPITIKRDTSKRTVQGYSLTDDVLSVLTGRPSTKEPTRVSRYSFTTGKPLDVLTVALTGEAETIDGNRVGFKVGSGSARQLKIYELR